MKTRARTRTARFFREGERRNGRAHVPFCSVLFHSRAPAVRTVSHRRWPRALCCARAPRGKKHRPPPLLLALRDCDRCAGANARSAQRGPRSLRPAILRVGCRTSGTPHVRSSANRLRPDRQHAGPSRTSAVPKPRHPVSLERRRAVGRILKREGQRVWGLLSNWVPHFGLRPMCE